MTGLMVLVIDNMGQKSYFKHFVKTLGANTRHNVVIRDVCRVANQPVYLLPQTQKTGISIQSRV